MAAEASIADVTASCLNHFNDCLGVDSLMANEWAENRLADFNIWIFSTGATARGRSSLDSRLASSSGTQELIIELLNLLDGLICQARDFDQDARAPDSSSMPSDDEDLPQVDQPPDRDLPRSFSPWSDAVESDGEQASSSIVPDNPLLKKMTHIEAILDQLARVSIAIRRSSSHSRLEEADQRLDPDEHTMFREHLTAILLRRPGQIFGLTEVQRRLVDANIKRRNRFLYARAHAAQSIMQVPNEGSHTRNTVNQSTGNFDGTVENDPESSVQDRSKSNSLSRAAIGITAPWTVISKSSSLDNTKFTVPAAQTTQRPAVIIVKYPHPPVTKDDAQVFTCPYCFEALPIEFLDENRWKQHLAGDIVPYTCILPRCATPDALFPTKNLWYRHLLEEHHSLEYWTCLICRNGIELLDEAAFMTHTNSQHVESVSQDRIPILAGLSRRSFPAEIKYCMFCDWPQAEVTEVDKEDLIEHIAQELHAFSLHSLPWPDGPEEEAAHWGVTNKKVTNPLLEKEALKRTSSVTLMESSGKQLSETEAAPAAYFQRNQHSAESSPPMLSSKSTSSAVLDHNIEDLQKKFRASVPFASNPSRPFTRAETSQEISNHRADDVRRNWSSTNRIKQQHLEQRWEKILKKRLKQPRLEQGGQGQGVLGQDLEEERRYLEAEVRRTKERESSDTGKNVQLEVEETRKW